MFNHPQLVILYLCIKDNNNKSRGIMGYGVSISPADGKPMNLNTGKIQLWEYNLLRHIASHYCFR